MTYTEIGLMAVVLAIAYDRFFTRTSILRTKLFWVSYAVVVFFQLLTNGVLTGLKIVRYNGDFIIGESTLDSATPAFLGSGRIAFAPIEDLLFGFAMIVVTIATWVWSGRSKNQ